MTYDAIITGAGISGMWQTGVNRNAEGRTVRRVPGYNGNGVNCRRVTAEVADGGYREFAFR